MQSARERERRPVLRNSRSPSAASLSEIGSTPLSKVFVAAISFGRTSPQRNSAHAMALQQSLRSFRIQFSTWFTISALDSPAYAMR